MTQAKKRSLRRRLAYCLVIFTLFLGFLESGIRLLWERPRTTMGTEFANSGLFRADANCGWSMNPNVEFVHELPGNEPSTIHTNSEGLRSPEHSLEAADGIRRVVMIGDSYVYGWGVEDGETIAARLQKLSTDTEVINLGVSGYNLAQSHRRLVDVGLRYEPDIVVLSVCYNDVEVQAVPAMTDRRLPERQEQPMSWKAKISSYSRLVDFLRYSASMVRPVRRTLQAIGLKEPDGGYEQLDITLRPALLHYPESLVAQWQSTVDELRAVHRTCKAAGAELVVVLIPPHEFCVPGTLGETLAYVTFAPADFDPGRVPRQLAEVCESEGLLFVDPASSLKSEDGRFYLRFDMHLSPAGNEVVARAVFEGIEGRRR